MFAKNIILYQFLKISIIAVIYCSVIIYLKPSISYKKKCHEKIPIKYIILKLI